MKKEFSWRKSCTAVLMANLLVLIIFSMSAPYTSESMFLEGRYNDCAIDPDVRHGLSYTEYDSSSPKPESIPENCVKFLFLCTHIEIPKNWSS